jgi:hypothetical protein
VAGADPDFFVSYTHSDERWAEWISWVLEEAGHRVLLQAWDFTAGAHFVAEMHRATQRAARTVAVLSTAYQASAFAAAEWQAAWAADPSGQARKLLVVRVEDGVRDGLLRQVVAVDLFGIDRATAKARLLGVANGDRRKPADEPAFPTRGEPALPGPPAVWQMPWPRNPHFVGREVELTALRTQLTTGVPQAVHGLGGVGKTQLAVEYAYRHATDYDLVWWLPAEQPASTVTALAELAEHRGVAVAGKAMASADAAVDLLRTGQRLRRWLVIVDNAVVESDLRGLLPAAGPDGHVLVTTRDPSWSAAAREVAVDVLPRTEAVALLRARAPRLTAAEAAQIAEALGDLPLAVEQAGAWLATSGMSATDYLDAVRVRTRAVLAEGTRAATRRRSRPRGPPRSTPSTRRPPGCCGCGRSSARPRSRPISCPRPIRWSARGRSRRSSGSAWSASSTAPWWCTASCKRCSASTRRPPTGMRFGPRREAR